MMTHQKHVPALRFPEFTENWAFDRLGDLVSRVGKPLTIIPEKLYREVGIRSHGKGLFHKKPVTGKSLGNKRVFRVHIPAFVVNIVFAWEHAIAITSEDENGFIASHRFPMFVPIDQRSDLSFVHHFFSRKYGKHLLGLASPGGAGRNRTLGQKDFAELKVIFPDFAEQKKIAAFLSSVDTKIEQLGKKKSLLEQYKKGIMQKLFSQGIRFKNEQGDEYPGWEGHQLGDIAEFSKGRGVSKNDIVDDGAVKCIRYGELYMHYGETITDIRSSTNLSANQLILSSKNDVIIPASGETAIDIATASCVLQDDIALGGDLNIIRTKENGIFLAYYLNSNKKIEIARLAQGISVVHLYATQLKTLKLLLPSIEEQQKIADFLSATDQKTELVSTELELAKTFKKGLLQQMFI